MEVAVNHQTIQTIRSIMSKPAHLPSPPPIHRHVVEGQPAIEQQPDHDHRRKRDRDLARPQLLHRKQHDQHGYCNPDDLGLLDGGDCDTQACDGRQHCCSNRAELKGFVCVLVVSLKSLKSDR